MYWDCNPTIYRPSTATDRGHYGLTKPLPDINLLSVQRQTLQTVTRYSYGVSSFCCCSRNCDAEHRGKRPFDLPTDDTTLVTLRWRYFHRRRHDEIDPFHHHLNEQNTDIQFTREVEENGKLPFLDCLVSRDENSLRTAVYRKPTHTDRLLDESSHNPTSHKATTISTLTRRAQLVCNTTDSLSDKNKYLDRVFSKNNYNEDFIRRNTHKPTTTTGIWWFRQRVISPTSRSPTSLVAWPTRWVAWPTSYWSLRQCIRSLKDRRKEQCYKR